MSTRNTPIIDTFEVAKIHWKTQATVHFILSLPIALLTVFSWGVPADALFRLFIAYLALYIIIYLPLYRILPIFTLRPVKNEIRKLNANEKLDDAELEKLITFLMNYPMPTAVITVFIEFSAFALGALVWKTGLIVPELLPIIGIALLETYILGFVVAINISFLNLVQLENYTSNIVEQIVLLYPKTLEREFPIRRLSMYTKILFLILLTTIAGEISILIFFTTYILSYSPEQFFENARFVLAAIAINILYIFVLAPIVAKNFTAPMHKLVNWIKDVTQGNMGSRISFLTNDETADIISGSNIMITRLNKMSDELTNSFEMLKNKQQLVESEKNTLSTVLFGVVDGVIALNKNREIILLNKAGEEITGFNEKDAIHKQIGKIFNIRDEHGEILNTENLFQPTTIQTSTSYTNVRLLTKTGKEKFINFTCSTIGDIPGTETVYILTFHDTTEEQQLEKMKMDFVSMAAHELRTPLTSIRGYLTLMNEQLGSSLTKDQQMFLNRIEISTQQLVSLVENLLSVTRIEKGTYTVKKKYVNLAELLEQNLDDFKIRISEKNLILDYKKPKDKLPDIYIDPLGISEVVRNLVSNAIAYTPPNGKITVWIEVTDKDIITYIQDTGQGIPAEALPHLFTKFFRVSGTLEQGSKGNGLGLYISKSIIDIHGGKLLVTSEVDEGSTFSFSLPKTLENTPPQ